jgi:hypothetical protein
LGGVFTDPVGFGGDEMPTTAAPEMAACLVLRLKSDLYVQGVKRASRGTVLNGYPSPGYDRRAGWVVEVGHTVVELFIGDYEMLTVSRIVRANIPETILKYINPDYRGITTMPHRADQRAEWHTDGAPIK